MGGSFQSDDPNGGAFGTGYSDPVGGFGEHSTDPETGQANSAIGKLWQGFTGKSGPIAPRLPAGMEWLAPFTQNLAQGAPVEYGASTAAQGAGVAGSTALGMTAAGTMPGTAAAWNAGLGGLGEGISTGFMPDLAGIDAILRPGLNRSFASGAADLREQNALMGNLSSTGAGQQMVDYRSQLENGLNQNVAGIYGNALPTSMNTRAGLTTTALGLPGQNAQQIYGPAGQLGLSGQDQVLNAIRTAFMGIGAAPYSGQAASGGNAGLGTAAGALMSKGGCWVAEAILGVDTPETLAARHYVNNIAPDEFRLWYLANGERLAELVKSTPELADILRPLFIAFGDVAMVHIAKAR